MSAEVVNRDWMIQAACRDRDPEWWFPRMERQVVAQAATQICKYCPVVADCRAYAAAIDAHYGIWAGEYRCEHAGYHQSDFRLSPCGTLAAYRRHQRRGENPCERCREAQALSRAERKQRQVSS